MSDTITFDDVWKMFQEMKVEAEKDRKETDRVMRNLSIEAEKDRKETDRVVRNLSKEISNLGSKWGRFVENMVAPACGRLFAERGIPVHEVSQRVKRKLDNGQNMEVDILVVNNDVVVLVEVKSTLTLSDVRDHLDRLEKFKMFFPQYRTYRIMGAVAGMIIDDGVDNFAKKQGLFVIVQSGDTVNLANEPNFKPHSW